MLDKRKFYIDGKWVNPYKKNDCEVINPCNEDPFAVISLGSKEDTDLAVKSAQIAFETWKETTKNERINYLEKLLSVYKKRFGEMAEAISLEMGAPMDWSSDVFQAGASSEGISANAGDGITFNGVRNHQFTSGCFITIGDGDLPFSRGPCQVI